MDTSYEPVQMGHGGHTERGTRRYLRVFTAPGEHEPRAGLHPEPAGVPADGWSRGEPLTTPADAALAAEESGGDRETAERALLAIAATRRALTNEAERVWMPKDMRVWKTHLEDAVSRDFDYVFGHDETAMRTAGADLARRNAKTMARSSGSVEASDDAIDRIGALRR